MKQLYSKSLAALVIFCSIMTPLGLASANSSISLSSPTDGGLSGKTTSKNVPISQWAGRGAAPDFDQSIRTLMAPSPAPMAQPECPLALRQKCKFVPAAYQQTDPTNPAAHGNYDLASRPADGLKINSVVIHDTESSLSSTLTSFQDPIFRASSHYVIDADGTIYQMVRTKDVAWHAGNWYINQHSIGIEHVGVAAEGRTSYTPQMYQSSALLVRWLAAKYDIPRDRQHIIGHDHVPGPTPERVAGMHYDPGPFWNWQHYLALMGAPVAPTARPDSRVIAIAPNFFANRPAVTSCSSGTCTLLPPQGANFIYLHTEPRDTAPLLSDPALHPDGQPGTTRIEDWSAKADYGSRFIVAGRQGSWTGIWFAGQAGWFKSPPGINPAVPVRGQSITPRAGLTSIPVYGRPYPEAGAYPAAVPVQAVAPLQYSIPAGQSYVTAGLAPTNYYYTGTFESWLPGDNIVVIGEDKYYLIHYNHRLAYVKASDVVMDSN